MKMMVPLLISTVAMLVSPAVVSPAVVSPAVASPAVASPTQHKPVENLNSILDLAVKYSKSVKEEFFVEDVSRLAEGGCEDKFFCKVHDVLHKHEDFGKKEMEEEKLVKKLKIFIDGRNLNCTVLLEGVTSTGIHRPIPQLMEYLIQCIQRNNISKP